MKKVTTVELLENNVSLGYAPVIEIKGKKPIMILEKNKPVVFKTKKEAKKYGENFQVTKTINQD